MISWYKVSLFNLLSSWSNHHNSSWSNDRATNHHYSTSWSTDRTTQSIIIQFLEPLIEWIKASLFNFLRLWQNESNYHNSTSDRATQSIITQLLELLIERIKILFNLSWWLDQSERHCSNYWAFDKTSQIIIMQVLIEWLKALLFNFLIFRQNESYHNSTSWVTDRTNRIIIIVNVGRSLISIMNKLELMQNK